MLSEWKNMTFFSAPSLYAGLPIFASVFDKFFVFLSFFVKNSFILQIYEFIKPNFAYWNFLLSLF